MTDDNQKSGDGNDNVADMPAAANSADLPEVPATGQAGDADEPSDTAAGSNSVAEPPVAAPPVAEPPLAAPPVAEQPAAEPPERSATRPSIKIGTQREDVKAGADMKARPQSLTTGRDTTAAASAALTATEGAAEQQQKQNYPPPRLESRITPEIQKEIDAAIGDLALDDLMLSSGALAGEELDEGDSAKGRVLSVRNDFVFVDLGRRNQGVVSVKQFKVVPEANTTIDVVVSRFDAEEGVYELIVPGAAIDVAGWDELSQGMVVEAVVTGHNKGGLEVEVNRLRGFLPISQIALFRIENLEEFVGQKFSCVVTEVNPERRNLVVSRRAILEREKEEAKEKLLKELQVGQMREGTVTRLQPFGAFVDIGGVDGLLHISQLSWDRVGHPSEVLTEGQKIKVKIAKIDPDTGKIGLAYRDTFENPWTGVENRYKPKTQVTGTVSRLMDFGAFVRLEAGIEGLIHISELAHGRVFRTGDVVSEGQEVDVQILSVDPDKQRISLSLKALQARPESAKQKKGEQDDDPVPSPRMSKVKHKGDLKGGTGRSSGGEQFGLKW